MSTAPEMLAVALDKASYKAGETATLKVSSRHGGRALISIIGDELIETRDITVAKGDAEISLPVGRNWGAGVYVIAALYRAMEVGTKRMPQRSLGLAWLGIDQRSRTLNVSLELPDKVRSGAKLPVPIRLEGLKSGETAHVTVAAVDVGVLSLTRFKTPAPETWLLRATHTRKRIPRPLRSSDRRHAGRTRQSQSRR